MTDIHTWLHEAKPQKYLLDNLKDREGFISAVKEFIDEADFWELGYVVEFSSDWKELKKFELIKPRIAPKSAE